MYYLIYLSAATSLLSEAELNEILTISRRNNERAGITGLLLYHEGAILQILEGDRQKVDSLYSKLSLDTRHRQLTKMVDGESAERYFDEWSMGYRKLNAHEWNSVEGYLPIKKDALKFKETETGSAAIVTFVRSFCQSNFSRIAM